MDHARRLLTAGLFCAIGAVICPAGAVAQAEAPTSAELAEARALFLAGEAAAQSGRWTDAIERFGRSYELSEVPAALYNFAYALRSVGRSREARDAFARFLASHPEADAELRDRAGRYRAEEEARIATLVVTELGDGSYRVVLDGGRLADSGERPLEVPSDPGSHTLTIRGDGNAPFVWEGVLAAGERRWVAYAPELGGAGARVADEGESDGLSVLESPWFWIGSLVALAAIGGGVGYYLVWSAGQVDPGSDRVLEL